MIDVIKSSVSCAAVTAKELAEDSFEVCRTGAFCGDLAESVGNRLIGIGFVTMGTYCMLSFPFPSACLVFVGRDVVVMGRNQRRGEEFLRDTWMGRFFGPSRQLGDRDVQDLTDGK